MFSSLISHYSSQALVGNPSRSRQLQTKPCIFGLACSSYVKSASASWAEGIITLIQRPKRQCSSMLWSMESMTRHNRSPWSSTHSGLSCRCLGTALPLDPGRSGREREVDCAPPVTIIQFKVHVILISNTQSQQAHICKSYKKPFGDGRAAGEETLKASCSCGPAHRRLGSLWSLSLRTKQYRNRQPNWANQKTFLGSQCSPH